MGGRGKRPEPGQRTQITRYRTLVRYRSMGPARVWYSARMDDSGTPMGSSHARMYARLSASFLDGGLSSL